MIIDGIETTADLFEILSTNETFINGTYDIHWLENSLEDPSFLET